MMREGSSLSVRSCDSSMMAGWIFYHDQVPWAADACKTEFGSVPNLSNYDNFFNKFIVFVVITQRRV